LAAKQDRYAQLASSVGPLRASPFSIETLMTMAAVGAVAIGEAEEAAVVIVLFAVGDAGDRGGRAPRFSSPQTPCGSWLTSRRN